MPQLILPLFGRRGEQCFYPNGASNANTLNHLSLPFHAPLEGRPIIPHAGQLSPAEAINAMLRRSRLSILSWRVIFHVHGSQADTMLARFLLTGCEWLMNVLNALTDTALAQHEVHICFVPQM